MEVFTKKNFFSRLFFLHLASKYESRTKDDENSIGIPLSEKGDPRREYL